MLESKIFLEGSEVSDREIKNVTYVEVESISKNPSQPKKHFSKASLDALCESIRKNGISQPVNIKKVSSNSYELVSGEKRLKAALMIGLREIPAIVVKHVDDEKTVAELLKKLKDESMDYLDEAAIYSNLISEYGFTQEELAQKIGKSQSTIANKIRLLKLSESVKTVLKENNFTERHARALLKISDDQVQLKVVKYACEKGYNVKKTEELVQRAIDKFLSPEKKKQFIKAICSTQEVKVFVHTVKQSLNELKSAGVNVRAAQIDRGEFVEFIIRIPKSESKI